MFGRINFIHARAEDGQGPAAGFQRSLVGNRIHPTSQAANYGDAVVRQEAGEFFGHLAAIAGNGARPNDGHRPVVFGAQGSAQIEHGRRLVDFF